MFQALQPYVCKLQPMHATLACQPWMYQVPVGDKENATPKDNSNNPESSPLGAKGSPVAVRTPPPPEAVECSPEREPVE